MEQQNLQTYRVFLGCMLIFGIILLYLTKPGSGDVKEPTVIIEVTLPSVTENTEIEDVFIEKRISTTAEINSDDPSTNLSYNRYTNEELEALALIAMAEAEGESDLGLRLVIDVVLNRVDHDWFENSVLGVIFEPGQFSPTENGRYEAMYVDDHIYDLVLEEVVNRTNSEVLFFRTDYYHPYGTPMFVEGCHFFSGE